MSKKIVAVISGGMDSITMLHKLHSEGNELKAISFNYGQRHKKELEMAKINCADLGIEHKIIDISFMKDLASNSALTGDIDVPEGHYEDSNMKQTVVPNRNMILASLAISHAVNVDYDAIALGVHSGDHEIYPDCREEFIKALHEASLIANYKAIEVLAPFQHANKTEIIKQGLEIGVDYAKTWTCYVGGEKACGRCGSCQERLEAFRNNGVEDPLEYETREILTKTE